MGLHSRYDERRATFAACGHNLAWADLDSPQAIVVRLRANHPKPPKSTHTQRLPGAFCPFHRGVQLVGRTFLGRLPADSPARVLLVTALTLDGSWPLAKGETRELVAFQKLSLGRISVYRAAKMPGQAPTAENVQCLLRRLDEAAAPTDDELRSMFLSPTLVSGLDHWALWTLVGLARHVERQKWVGYVVETRLKGDLHQIGVGGALGHPEGQPQQGPVPDEPDWEYFFHGCGCCLTNRRAGTSIDVDFDRDGSSEAIDPFFYSNFLASLRTPELPERLLQRPQPFENAWHAEIATLKSSGCLTRQHRTRLTTLGRDIAEAVQPVIERLHSLLEWDTGASRKKSVLAALALGDPILAKQIATGEEGATAFASELANECSVLESRRALQLRTAVEQSREQRPAEFVALASMRPHFSREVVSRALFRNPVDGLANTALKVLDAWNDDDLPDMLIRLLMQRQKEAGLVSRVMRALQPPSDSDDAAPRDYQIVHAAIALLRRVDPRFLSDDVRRMILALMPPAGSNAGEAALVTYALDRDAGLAAIASVLSYRVPAAYRDAVAACVIIGTPEAKALLAEALHSGKPEIQHSAACALNHFADANAKKLARDWNRQNDGIDDPLGEDVTIGDRTIQSYTFQDVSHANMDAFFASALEGLRSRFASILARDSTGPCV